MASPLHHLDDPAEFAREREAFVEAGFALLFETDVFDLQVAQVVRHAGRHNDVFYRVLGSKEGFILALLEEAVRRMVALLERRMARAATPEEAVRTWTTTLLGLTASGKSMEGIMLERSRINRRFPEAQSTITRPLVRPLERVLRAAGVSRPRVVSEAALEMVVGREAIWIALRHRPTKREVTTYADLTVRLVGLERR
ncbi:MAG: putative HTH-type transcriptional regulator [Frankiales bacterium]|nr:putative HTH-type transcriptional regulator [Frankiales bacterium]